MSAGTDERRRRITLKLNGHTVSAELPVRQSLADFLRLDQALTATHLGCETGACGACSVLVDGVVVRGCLMLGVQAEGATVDTLEGLTANRELAVLQQTFFERAALQCGFCTNGMLLTAAELLRTNLQPDRAEIRAYLSGNYCRCTGYEAIVDAVLSAAQRLSEPETAPDGVNHDV